LQQSAEIQPRYRTCRQNNHAQALPATSSRSVQSGMEGRPYALQKTFVLLNNSIAAAIVCGRMAKIAYDSSRSNLIE
jgi:hypothetical protein